MSAVESDKKSMGFVEFFLIGIFALAAWLMWWLDLFCLRSTHEKCVSREACKRFCAKRNEGCQIQAEDADAHCTDKPMHAEAKAKFLTAQASLKAKSRSSEKH